MLKYPLLISYFLYTSYQLQLEEIIFKANHIDIIYKIDEGFQSMWHNLVFHKVQKKRI